MIISLVALSIDAMLPALPEIAADLGVQQINESQYVLVGNLNAMAMEPLGQIAGLGSAVVGSVSTLISVVFGVVISNAYDGTVYPLANRIRNTRIGWPVDYPLDRGSPRAGSLITGFEEL